MPQPPGGGAGGMPNMSGAFPGGAGGMPGFSSFSFHTGGGGGPPPRGGGYSGFSPSSAEDIFSQFFGGGGMPFGAGGSNFGSSSRRHFDSDMHMGGMDDDMFAGMHGMPGAFGGGGIPSGTARRTASMPAEPEKVYTHNLTCTLEDLYTGTTKKLKFSQPNGAEPLILTNVIKPGYKAGTKIKHSNALLAADGTKQTVEVIIQEAKHPRFTRDGDNLRADLEVSLDDALGPIEKSLESLDGRKITIKTSKAVQPGQVIWKGGEGMPNSKTGKKGDLFVTLKVRIPPLLENQVASIRNILRTG